MRLRLGQIPSKENIHSLAQFLFERLLLLFLAGFLKTLDGPFGISGQKADKNQHGSQNKGGDHQRGEVRGKGVPEKVKLLHPHRVVERKPEEKTHHDEKKA